MRRSGVLYRQTVFHKAKPKKLTKKECIKIYLGKIAWDTLNLSIFIIPPCTLAFSNLHHIVFYVEPMTLGLIMGGADRSWRNDRDRKFGLDI